MMPHRQRILMAAREEMPDALPYAPRIDLCYDANSLSGTLPERHKGRTQDEISRAEGWALHKIIPEYLKVRSPKDNLHRAIGVFSLKETPFSYQFSSDIEIKVNREPDSIHVEYHTPIGMVSTTTVYTKKMRKAGASITWVKEHVIKKPEDYPVVGYVFNNLKLIPDFDDMLTYPSFFEKEIAPWIRKAADNLGAKGKIVICHCDGENSGLLDLIKDSGMHVAEAVTPYPMTKVKIGEYYQRWGDKLTIWGHIPGVLLTAETATDQDLEA